jgi:hypothetical protein
LKKKDKNYRFKRLGVTDSKGREAGKVQAEDKG